MSDNTVTAAPMTDAEIRAFISKLLEEKGETALQQMLQQRIQKTKKVESETATVTKRADAEKRQADSYRDESTKFLHKAKILEQHCTAVSKEVTEWPERKQKRVDEWASRMASVSSNVDTEAKTLSDKMDADDEFIKTREAENAEMKAKFDGLRAEFDDAFKAYEVSWKEREEQTKATIAELQEAQHTNNLLKAQSLLQDKHVQRLTESITSYSEQIEMYEARMGDVEATALRSEDIKKLADKQEQQIQDQIDTVEASKRMDVEEKQRFDNEAQKLRTKVLQLKKKFLALEKTKTTAEARCRNLQKKNVEKK